MIESLANAGLIARLSLMVAVAPLVMGITYAIRPSEARLALMRPISLAGIFGALCGFSAGVIHTLVGAAQSADGLAARMVPVGLAEAIVPLSVGFACLTVAWLCVALGLRRQS